MSARSRDRHERVRRALAGIVTVAWLSAAGAAGAEDTLLGGDPIDPASGRVIELAPGAPWVQAGPDGILGTSDDEVDGSVRGDVDLVVRTGLTDWSGPIPPPAAATGDIPRGEISVFGKGTPIDFVVIPVDADGEPATAPYLEGMPIVAFAFGDLDGDGYIGITHLDGDPTDAAVERAELEPIGRRYALIEGGRAVGQVQVQAAGPEGAPLRVAVTAAAYAGVPQPGEFDGVVPDGPAVMTRLPFHPLTDPAAALTPFPLTYLPADPEGRVAMRALPAWIPDPADPRIGEAFTLPLDGSDPSIDVAEATSGHFVRLGFVCDVSESPYLALPTRPVRPGLDADGNRQAYEVLLRASVPDDGPASVTRVRLVPLDPLGNITSIHHGHDDEHSFKASTKIRLKARGGVRIVHPDQDGHPEREEIKLADALGLEIVLDDAGGAFDDATRGALMVRVQERVTRIDVSMPDPDVDDDGLVTFFDHFRVHEELGSEYGDGSYEAVLDLDGSGRIDESDLAPIEAMLGEPLVQDSDGPKDRGNCSGKVLEAVFRFTGQGCDATTNVQGGKLECEGLPGDGSVEVVLTKDEKKMLVAPQTVWPGQEFRLSSVDGKKLKGKTELELRGEDSLQRLELKTGCSKRLSVNDQFGALRLVELTTTEGGTAVETPVYGDDDSDSDGAGSDDDSDEDPDSGDSD